MKAWIVLLLLIISATINEVSAKSIELEVTPKRQDFTQWWDAKFQVRIVPVDGFDAQVFVRLTESTIPWNYIHAPATTLYPPYDKAFEITVSAAAWSFGGEQRIIVEAVNGPVIDYDTMYVVAPQHREWRRITPLNSPLPDEYIRQIIHDRDGTAWIIGGSPQGSLVRMGTDGSQQVITSAMIDPSQEGISFLALAIDSSNALWVAWGINVSRYKDGTWTTYNHTNSPLPFMSVGRIIADRRGSVWLSASYRLVRFDGTTSDVFTVGLSGKEFLPPNFIAVLFDEQNRLWGTYNGGLMRYEDGIWREITKNELGIPSNATMNLTYDNNGILTGTYSDANGNGGLIRFRDNRWQLEEAIPKYDYPNYTIGVPYFDSRGVMWMRSSKVVTRYDGKEWRYFNTYNSGFPDAYAQCISIAPDGSVWIGTEGAGIAVYTSDILSSIPVQPERTVPSGIMSIIPNPVSGNSCTAVVELRQTSDVHLSVTDMLGRVLETRVMEKQSQGRCEVQIGTATLSVGLYMVKLASTDGICSVPLIIRK